MRYTTALLLVAALAGAASADSYTFNPAPGISLTVTNSVIRAGYVTNVLTLTTDTDWLSAGMIVNPTPTTSRVYNATGGSSAPVIDDLYDTSGYPPDLVPINTTTKWADSYLTAGQKLGADTMYEDLMSWVQASIAGGAVDLGGAAAAVFNNNAINAAWFTTYDDEIGTLVIAQVTLKNDAQGTWKFITMNAGGDVIHPLDTLDPLWDDPLGGHQHMAIHSGVMTPEPATLSLLVLGGVAALIRRKR
jgi:hypothetical protein